MNHKKHASRVSCGYADSRQMSASNRLRIHKTPQSTCQAICLLRFMYTATASSRLAHCLRDKKSAYQKVSTYYVQSTNIVIVYCFPTTVLTDRFKGSGLSLLNIMSPCKYIYIINLLYEKVNIVFTKSY